MPYGPDFLQRYNQYKRARFRLVDADKGCVVWHDGQATESGTAVTAATIEATADTSITLKVNGAVDSRIGTAGVLAVTTYDTFQKLANNINAAKGWHCQLVDARGADATSNIDAITAVSCFKTAGTAVERDNSDTKQFGCGIVAYGYGNQMDKGKQAFLEAAYSNIVHADNDYDLYIYDCDDTNQSDTLIMQTKAANTATDYWLPTYGPTGFPILSVAPGHRILVYTLCSGDNDPEALSMVGAIGAVVPVF